MTTGSPCLSQPSGALSGECESFQPLRFFSSFATSGGGGAGRAPLVPHEVSALRSTQALMEELQGDCE